MADHDTTKALRIAKMLDLLNKRSPYGGISISEMAKELEVSTRSIHRYLSCYFLKWITITTLYSSPSFGIILS